MPSRVAVLFVVSVLAVGHLEARGQQFGKNKVEYADFDFEVLETDHFAVYYYRAEETGARIMARLAERWYARLSVVLDHQLDGRQPLIVYASQPEFAQTNVVNGMLGEGIGGVTESARRRIVMPFAPTLAETDRILGHELTHAFQFDMARRYGGGPSWPLWAIEGLAQYLSLGGSDPETALWLRDAVAYDLLPQRARHAARIFSPYRYGHALWAYLAGRFGDRAIPEILKAKKAGSLSRRIKASSGLDLDALYADWRTAAHELHAAERPVGRDANVSRVLSAESGRLHVGPSLSPDGRHVAFFSERDRVSVELFLAEASTGSVRKLATTAASAKFESLQALRSAGSWSADGRRFVFGAVERGKAALVVLEPAQAGRPQVMTFPQFGQILSPAWSPDGGSIAFSALSGGLTDLWVYDLGSRALRQITSDPFTDLHPSWSPDGRRIAFVTDRFSTDLQALRFGPTELAFADVAFGGVARVPALKGGSHLNPQWGPEGGSLFFVSGAADISNVYRVDIASGDVLRITDSAGRIAGLTPTSPTLSVSSQAPALAYSVYRNGKFEIELRQGVEALTGLPAAPTASARAGLPPAERERDVVQRVLEDSTLGLPESADADARAYVPDLFLEAIGPPYLSSGSGAFGTFVRAGGGFLFSDLLGERKLAVLGQVGNQLRDLAVRVQFLNRERRWNWGAAAEVQPSLRLLPRMRAETLDGLPAFTSETHYFERTQLRLAGLLAYPLDRAQRFEFEAGARHVLYRRKIRAVARSIGSGKVLSRDTRDVSWGAPTTAAEVSAAYVRDTAVYGPAGPVLGGRSRLELESTLGGLSVTRVVLDHRRYLMPVKPYTFAMRVVHLGQYGRDAADLRVVPMFLGSQYFLRGYGRGTIACDPNAEGECSGFDELLGTRLLVGNLEVRAPLLGIRSRDLRYGAVPTELFAFADGGVVWSRAPEFSAARGERRMVRSFGFGVRLNALGLPLEWALVRATDRPSRGWSFGATFRPAF